MEKEIIIGHCKRGIISMEYINEDKNYFSLSFNVYHPYKWEMSDDELEEIVHGDIKYPLSDIIDGIHFELIAGGQHDTRNTEGLYKKNTVLYDYSHFLWDNYHLKHIKCVDKDLLAKFKQMIQEEPNIEEELEDYFYNHMEQ